MCYRCELCRKLVPHNTPKMTIIITREVHRTPRPVSRYEENDLPSHRAPQSTTRTEIAREIAVCADCKAKNRDLNPLRVEELTRSIGKGDFIVPSMKEVVKRSRTSHRFSTLSPENNL